MSNVRLRLKTSLLEEARRTHDYLRERAGRASLTKAKRLLRRAGKDRPPVPGDEL